MRIDLEDEEIDRVIRALEHYYAYTQSQQRTDSAYKRLAEEMKREREKG